MEWADNRTENEKRLEAKCAELEAANMALIDANIEVANINAGLLVEVEALREAASNLLSGMDDYPPSLGQKWLVESEDIDALAALITEKNDENDLRASLDALDAMWREKNDEYVPLP